MIKSVILVLICLQTVKAQTTYSSVQLGDSTIQIKQQCFSPFYEGLYFINLHSNETTSIASSIAFIQKNGGCFFQLMHREARNIIFNVGVESFKIDPNRIFTPVGCSATLIKNSSLQDTSYKIARTFAREILTSLLNPKLIVAMHNNSNNDFSILSYTKGKNEAKNTEAIFINKLMDVDDFVYTTELKIFNYFKTKNINVILQKSKGFVDDGSLSIYCSKNKIPYVNIEAEEGHLEVQLEMLDALKEVMNWYKTK